MSDTLQIESKYYKSITELPLHLFIDCIVDGNLSALIISGEPSREHLAASWENISQEYADAMNDDDYTLYVLLLKELGLLDINISLVENCVKILRLVYDEFYAKQVNDVLRTSFAFNWEDPDAYHVELGRAAKRALAMRNIEYALKKSQIEALDERFSSGEAKNFTRAYFQGILITLSDHAKIEIKDTITTYQFCERVRRLILYVKQVNKK